MHEENRSFNVEKMYTPSIRYYVIDVNARLQRMRVIMVFYTGLISHNGLGGVECDVTIVQKGMAPSEYCKGGLTPRRQHGAAPC